MTYAVTDSAIPAVTITVMFQFPVISATAALTLQDWDATRYRLTTRVKPDVLMLIDGTVDIGAADKTIWARPPRGTVGTVVTDDLDDYGIGENATQITRLLFKYTNTSVVVNHNSKNPAGETAFFDFIGYIAAYPDRHISFHSLLHGEWTAQRPTALLPKQRAVQDSA